MSNKLTEADKAKMKAMKADGHNNEAIAKELGVSNSVVWYFFNKSKHASATKKGIAKSRRIAKLKATLAAKKEANSQAPAPHKAPAEPKKSATNGVKLLIGSPDDIAAVLRGL